ncbi:MAG: RICIN domain-containing protein [Prevotella sp.]|nr:RICIN domain-containing protein [Prevotella sp.]
MKRLSTILLGLSCLCGSAAAQTSGATGATAWPIADTDVPFRMADSGLTLPRIAWGLDLCWLSEGNLQRGANFAGRDMIDIIRVGFRATSGVEQGALGTDQTQKLDERIGYVLRHTPQAKVNLASDTADDDLVDSWYKVSNSTLYGQRWAKMIRLHQQRVEQRGLQVASISPFNEPDFGWGQGGKAEFLAVCKAIRDDASFGQVLLSGGNTLNDDQATPWFDYLKDYLDQGNTHQLAGSFDNFANFFTHVAAEGKQGVLDEMHNIIEPMVASEYGMTQGIWWGTCEHTRSEFMRATRGQRLGYAENRDKWTAASVFRMPEREGMTGERRVKGFVGTSERQAATTRFRFLEPTHEVWYDGVGPTRDYIYTIPGGTGYQTGQVNAEGHVTIQDGQDIMPHITEGTYRIANRYSGLMLTGAATNGGNVNQTTSSLSNKNQQWTLAKLPATVVGDRNVWTLTTANGMAMDVLNWSLEPGGGIISYRGGYGVNEQWCLEYAGQGAFYIRSMHSGLYLQVLPGTDRQQRMSGRKAEQAAFTGDKLQQWVLVGERVVYDSIAPAPPQQLEATPLPSGVGLQWQPSAARDLEGYTLLRSTDSLTWHTINRNLTETTYIDNTAVAGHTYYYKVMAQDRSYNLSEPTNTAEATPTAEAAMLARLFVDTDTLDDMSGLGNHAAMPVAPTYTEASLPADNSSLHRALLLNGSTQFVQLPAAVGSTHQLTFCTWIYWQGGNNWQRLFDFGTDTDHYLFLTPRTSDGQRMRFAIKNGDTEQQLTASKALTAFGWHHVALTIDETAVTLYLDGQPLATTTEITLRPDDVMPAFCYIGRSQFAADPLLRARLHDVRIYNHALTSSDINAIASMTDGIDTPKPAATTADRSYDLGGRAAADRHSRGISISNGKKHIR